MSYIYTWNTLATSLHGIHLNVPVIIMIVISIIHITNAMLNVRVHVKIIVYSITGTLYTGYL